MILDVLGAIELTAGAAIAIAVASFSLGADVTTRRRLALVLGLWFAAVATLAASRALHYIHGIGAPGVALAVLLPVAALSVSLLRVPTLRLGLDRAPWPPLIAVHAVRIFGANFVLLHAAGRLPAPFAPVAGWGDIVVGLTALPLAWLVAKRGTAPLRGLLLAWTVFGLADLVAAITLGILSSPSPIRVFHAAPGTGIMSSLPWLIIPAFLVPLLAATHLAALYRLARDRRTHDDHQPTAPLADARPSPSSCPAIF